MWLEADVADDATRHDKSFVLGIEITITDEMIDKFNSTHPHAFILLECQTPHPTSGFYGKPYRLLWKRYPEEDPSEDLGPFDTREEATDALVQLWKLTGNDGIPRIECIIS